MEGRLVFSVVAADYVYKKDKEKNPTGPPLLRFTCAWGFIETSKLVEGKKVMMQHEACIGTFNESGVFQWGPSLNRYGYRYKQMNIMTPHLHEMGVAALEELGVLDEYRKKLKEDVPFAPKPVETEPIVMKPEGTYILE